MAYLILKGILPTNNNRQKNYQKDRGSNSSPLYCFYTVFPSAKEFFFFLPVPETGRPKVRGELLNNSVQRQIKAFWLELELKVNDKGTEVSIVLITVQMYLAREVIRPSARSFTPHKSTKLTMHALIWGASNTKCTTIRVSSIIQ